MPALHPPGLARNRNHDSTPVDGAASPTRSGRDKSYRSTTRFYQTSDYSHSNSNSKQYCLPRPYHNADIPHADHRQPGRTNHQSEITGGSARPAAQRASEPTARSAGGGSPKPRAAIGTEDRARETARKPGSPRSRDRTERPTGAESASGEIEARQAARTGKLDRAADECPDRASTAPGAERPAGAKRRSERASSPDRPPSAPRRSHGADQPEARACPRPGRSSALGDRREPLGRRCGLRCCSRWSA